LLARDGKAAARVNGEANTARLEAAAFALRW